MRKFAKVFSIIFFFCFLFVLALPFVFANTYYDNGIFYSLLPEPVPTERSKYFVVSNSTSKSALLYMFSCQSNIDISDFTVSVSYDSNNKKFTFDFGVETSSSNAPTVWVCIFDALTGSYQGFTQINLSSPLGGYYHGYFTTGALNNFEKFISYDCGFYNSGHLAVSSFVWNGVSDKNFQEYLLTQSLNSIELYLDSIDSYTGQITTDLFDYIHWVQNTFYPSFVNETTQIINKLNKIIELLGGDYSSTEIPQPSQADDINELASAEAAIQRDVGSDMQSAFSSYGQVFSGNGAFALIKTGFESFILDNNKINALIVFCLTLGIGVLIIGRRIQA